MQTLPSILLRRPLVDLNTVQAAFDCNWETVQRLIEDGTLRAFNLATESGKAMVRIVAADIEAAQRKQAKPAHDFSETLKLLFPFVAAARAGVVATVPVTILARRFGIRSCHVAKLTAQNCLQVVPGSKARTGPGGSALVTFESVATFLRRRQIQ